MREIDQIIEKLKQEKSHLQQEFNITEIGIFGSYTRDEQTENSDIDILIDYDKTKSFSLLELVGLEDYLGNLFGKKIDIITKNALKPRIGRQILNEVIYL